MVKKEFVIMKQGKLRFLSFRVMCVFLGLALIKLVLLCANAKWRGRVSWGYFI